MYGDQLSKSLAVVTQDAISRCFLSKQRAYNAVVCDRSFFSYTKLLQRCLPLFQGKLSGI